MEGGKETRKGRMEEEKDGGKEEDKEGKDGGREGGGKGRLMRTATKVIRQTLGDDTALPEGGEGEERKKESPVATDET